MRGILLTALFLLSIPAWLSSQVVLEDFEGGAKLNWNPLQGSFAVVDNPPGGDTLQLNSSAKVGAYTKQDNSSFSPLLAQLASPLDLSVNNQISILVKAAKTGFFIFKLEDPNNTAAVEQRKYIAVTNQWIKYTFNFSAQAARNDFTKIVIFFDAGVANSSDTYLFDNIVLEPSGACSGVAVNQDVIDDFECQRNVAVGSPGYLDLKPVDNPDKSGINTSDRVGQYTDQAGPFHALVYDFGAPIALGDRSIFKIKIWAPKAGRFVAKLEGGSSSPVERGPNISPDSLNRWVEYTVDFSDQVGANHRKLTMFFNFAVDEPAGTVYYIDDIRLEPIPPVPALEDFEGGAKLDWELAGPASSFGVFNGAIANPDKRDPNTSETVGSYTKGSSRFGGLRAALPLDFALGDEPQLNVQVWAPQGATSFTMQLFSPSQGLKSITRPIERTQAWVDLAFNFEEFKDVADFSRVELLFDQELSASGSQWYFDNLFQSSSTADPCEGTEPIPTIVDDFECQRKGTFNPPAEVFEIVRNPDPRGINPNASDRVGKYTDPFDQFSALVWNFGNTPIDLSTYNQLYVKIWSPKAVPLGFKLEGSATNNPIEIVAPVTTTSQWVQYAIDFSAAKGRGYTRLVIFFNFAITPTETDVYYIDDVEWRKPAYTACIVDFETPETSIPNWRTFANGPDEDVNVVVANPDKSGINTSNFVGQYIEKPVGENFAGMYTVNQDAPIALPSGVRTVRMKVWMPTEGRVVFKLERSRNGTPQTGDTFSEQPYTTPGKWQELTWNFAGKNIPDGELWDLMTIIPNFDTKPTGGNRVSYFDDIAIGDAQCGQSTSIFSAVKVDRLSVFPNPAGQVLTIRNTNGLQRFVVLNQLGQQLRTVQTTGQEGVEIDLDQLQGGIYILNGYDEQGRLRANTKFIKQ